MPAFLLLVCGLVSFDFLFSACVLAGVWPSSIVCVDWGGGVCLSTGALVVSSRI